MEWRSRLPDLNIVQNVWVLLARKICAKGRQVKDVESLTDAVGKGWEEIDKDYLKTLYQSLRTRLVEVIGRGGACTDY